MKALSLFEQQDLWKVPAVEKAHKSTIRLLHELLVSVHDQLAKNMPDVSRIYPICQEEVIPAYLRLQKELFKFEPML